MRDGASEASADSWGTQLRRGSLELAILASLWNKRLYGLEILRVLEGTSALGVAEGTLYLILARLKTEGLVAAEWVDARSGHPRKYYRLTATGKQRLRQMAISWATLAENINALLRPVLEPKEALRAER